MSSGEMSAESRTVTASQVFYWCVRRELFEHRSIYIAPAAAAGVALFGFLINTVHLPAQMRAAIADPAKMKGLSAPFEYVAAAIMMVAMIVQLFYCLDSSERIAAYFSGSRCRCPTRRPCWQRRRFRSRYCRC